MQFVTQALTHFVTQAAQAHTACRYALINVNPVGGGVRARGGDLTAKSIPSAGGLIEYLCSGVGTFDFFDRQTGTKIKRGYMASSFFALKSPVVS